MGASRSTRITILLCIDVVFFFVELISGYAVGSLALVADSFHMLNDVLSLIVALYAIKLSANNATEQYTYGWHRAEILGALVNGVFLLALCCSIFMEAIERFVTKPDISNPKIIIIVGGLGLLSNIVGLMLFHEHSHDHSHQEPGPELEAAPGPALIDERQPLLRSPAIKIPHANARIDSAQHDLFVHPAQTRAEIVQAAQEISRSHVARSPSTHRHSRHSQDKNMISPMSSRSDVAIDVVEPAPASTDTNGAAASPGHPHSHAHAPGSSAPASKSKAANGHSHSHGSMNMRALVLHVLGDALGNVGVIITGLVILLAHGTWRFYFDPSISIVIAVIIFTSALPLVKSTSLILLQGVPSHVSLNDVRQAISDVEGVISVHELHVWQLSETRTVASVHIQIARDSDYMSITSETRRVLHDHGIHSATVQPEYAPTSGVAATPQEAARCLVPCPPDSICSDQDVCCPPRTRPPSPKTRA